MSTTQKCNWPGKSGTRYTYHVYPIGTNFVDEKPANYAFCKKNAAGNWVPQYFGQTDNLKERMGGHHKLACAKRNGATHVHVRLNARQADRLAEEKDLIRNFNPCCNEQLVA